MKKARRGAALVPQPANPGNPPRLDVDLHRLASQIKLIPDASGPTALISYNLPRGFPIAQSQRSRHHERTGGQDAALGSVNPTPIQPGLAPGFSIPSATRKRAKLANELRQKSRFSLLERICKSLAKIPSILLDVHRAWDLAK